MRLDRYIMDPFAQIYAKRAPVVRKTPEEAARDEALKAAWLAKPENRSRLETLKAMSFSDAAEAVAGEKDAVRARIIKRTIERNKRAARGGKAAAKFDRSGRVAEVNRLLVDLMRRGGRNVTAEIARIVQSYDIALRLLDQAAKAGHVERREDRAASGRVLRVWWQITEKGMQEWK